MGTPRTQHRSVRVDDTMWSTFAERAAEHGGRGSVLRRLISLFLTDESVRRRVVAYGDDLARDRTALAEARSRL